MRAWQLRDAFGLDHLAPVTLDDPTPGPGEALLAIRAVSLNYRDLLMVTGRYDPRQPLPLVPCSDAVGEVIAVGEGVDRVRVGDRVCPIFNPGWLDGRLSRAALRTTLGGPLPGTLCERLTVPQEALVHAPAHLTDAEAATLPCAGVTAWRALVTEAGIGPGDTVLTLGTGGVSLFAVLLARLLGARVAITSSSPERLRRALELGAELGVDYTADPEWGRTAARWAGPDGVDLVVELGGAGTLDQSLTAVRPGGQVALIGVLAGARTDLSLTRVLMRAIRVQGILVGSRADLEALTHALARHPDVRPPIDVELGFDEVPEAFWRLRAGGHFGKIVVHVGGAA